MLRFDFSGSRTHRLRSKPFKLFSDELPVIDFEKQHLLQRLADEDFSKGQEYSRKRNKSVQEHDSHSLPTIGGPDWDLLSGSDRQSIKSDSRLNPLKPDLPQIHRKIRERLGLKEKQDDNSPNYFQRSIHRSDNTKSMPKPDEYKKFVQWPRLPSQQIVNQADMQQSLLDVKEEIEHKPVIHTRKENRVHNVQRQTKYRLKLDHAKLDLPTVRLNARHTNKRDMETQTPRDLSETKYENVKSTDIEPNDIEPMDTPKEAILDTNTNTTTQTSKQAVSILKKRTIKDTGPKPQESVFSSVTNRNSENDNDVIQALVHCDIPRRQLKKTVFNAYVGDVLISDNKGSKKVNFIEDYEQDKHTKPRIKVVANNETFEDKTSANQGIHQPKLVSSYSFQRKDLEQIARKHLLRDHTTKTQRLQNMMKHFRKIRGRQSMPHTVNLNVKTQTGERPLQDTGHSSLSSHSESITPSSVTPRNVIVDIKYDSPRNKLDITKHDSPPATSRLDMSKSESLNEDIETCIQIRKSHKNVKRHRKAKHAKVDEPNADVHDDISNKEVDEDSEIDRSLSGTELIRFYRFWNRRRRLKHPSGLRTIDEPTTVTDHFSNAFHKKFNSINRMSMIAETEGLVSDNA